jgi:nicotinate-nucleotide adenylyltransferase
LLLGGIKLNNKNKKYGIMGGTFNPIHIGHLILAEYAKDYFGLDKVIFIPTGKPPHKELDGIVSAKSRYEMVDLAIKDNPNFIISPLEIKREGTTYSVDTLKFLKREYPAIDFYFIVGTDSFVQIDSWKKSDILLRSCRFIVAKRLGDSLEIVEKKARNINNKYGDIIYLMDFPYIGISSSNIRERVKNGETVKYIIPKEVEKYINENKLYL